MASLWPNASNSARISDTCSLNSASSCAAASTSACAAASACCASATRAFADSSISASCFATAASRATARSRFSCRDIFNSTSRLMQRASASIHVSRSLRKPLVSCAISTSETPVAHSRYSSARSAVNRVTARSSEYGALSGSLPEEPMQSPARAAESAQFLPHASAPACSPAFSAPNLTLAILSCASHSSVPESRLSIAYVSEPSFISSN
mmetsp:Transcript_14715/g.48106  ORF Transcript_14715/g.48106 Transcript_14715/m.48106 type:complete len:210 (+) Transcript_14715:395-1024(+)